MLSCIILFSCKKESFRDFEGNWVSVAQYRQQPDGSFQWFPYGQGWRSFISFFPEHRFAVHSDVPEGGGSYSYDSRSKMLQLNYEANAWGGTANTTIRKVEKLEIGKLVLATYSNSGVLYSKTEYALTY